MGAIDILFGFVWKSAIFVGLAVGKERVKVFIGCL